MATQTFSKNEAINFGWDTVRNNLGYFIGLGLVIMATGVAPLAIKFVGKISPILSYFMDGVFFVLYLVIQVEIIKIALRFCENNNDRTFDFFSYVRACCNYFLGSILFGLITIVGIMLLIVPGVIWGVRFQFFSYLIVDKKMGAIDALKKSYAITKGATWELSLFGALLVVINFLGFLCLGIGLFVTIPMTMIATAYVYRKLESQTVTCTENLIQNSHKM